MPEHVVKLSVDASEAHAELARLQDSLRGIRRSYRRGMDRVRDILLGVTASSVVYLVIDAIFIA